MIPNQNNALPECTAGASIQIGSASVSRYREALSVANTSLRLQQLISLDPNVIDYEERLEDLYKHLQDAYLVNDRQAIDIILATRLQPDNGPWLIVETECFDYYLHEGVLWFAPEDEVISVRHYKEVRPRHANIALNSLLERGTRQGSTRQSRIWVDPAIDTEYKPHLNFHTWSRFEQACIRLRTKYRHAVVPDGAGEHLKMLINRVMDNRWRGPMVGPVAPESLPQHAAYWLELLQKIAKRQKSWGDLVHNFRQMYRRLIWLRNKSAGDEIEKMSLVRLMHDTVPSWTRTILERMDEGVKHQVVLTTPNMDSRKTSKEVWRLFNEGVTYRYYHEGQGGLTRPLGALYWTIRKEIKTNVLKLIRGEVEL